MNQHDIHDLLVIGGGVNGAAIARDAAGRGLGVMLVDKGDLAGATSSASSKLIHGGLRYLEQYDFGLVRASLREREVMLQTAPHIVWPMTFVLPHRPPPGGEGGRPVWMLRLGLWLYDHLGLYGHRGGRQSVPRSRHLDLSRDPLGGALGPGYKDGFAYTDCWVDDARLVVLNARDAADRGADIHTRTACTHAERKTDHWVITLCGEGRENAGQTETVRARAVVNAAGPWVADVDRDVIGVPPPGKVRLVKGSHIVVPRLYTGKHAHILQTDDGRVVFVLPYENDFTLIGTTEVDLSAMPDRPMASTGEIEYLCRTASSFMARAVRPADVTTSFAGVRALFDTGGSTATKVSRDYLLKLHHRGGAPALSVYGGKITTARQLAEKAMNKLARHLPAKPAWTSTTALPGGDLGEREWGDFLARMQVRYPWLPPALLERYGRAYGTRMERIVGGHGSLKDLGADMGTQLFEAELRYLVREEWATTAEDILWRRTKIGLHAGPEITAKIDAWLTLNRTPQAMAETGQKERDMT